MNETRALMPINIRPPVPMVRGQGAWLYDATGRAYLDFVQGWAVNALGHCPPVVVQALTRQAGELINPSPAFYSPPLLELANLLAEKSRLDRVFFANSGAEANEGAIKLARKWGAQHGGRHEIITFQHAFHGRTLATMAASGKAGWERLFAPTLPGFVKVPFNDIAAVRHAIGPTTVGIMLEPIQGEAGVIPAAPGFIAALRDLATQRGLLLMVDEIQTGLGRTGRAFAHQASGVQPDIMTLGKGLGGGVPLSALLARDAVCCFAPGEQGGTFNGNPLMTAAGLAVANTVLTEDFLATVRLRGQTLTAVLQTLSARFGLGEVRGQGLLQALILPQGDGAAVVERAYDHGLLINSPRPDCLRFMPALNVTPEELTLFGERLATALTPKK